MRFNITLATLVAMLAIALGWVYLSMNARVQRLEAELRLMDVNLKQFAMPMEDLRRDIAAIHRELDQVDPVQGDDSETETLAAAPPPARENRAESPRLRAPPVREIPAGPVHYGNPVPAYDDPGEREAARGLPYSGPIDEEDD